jgi:hypothetical protein
VKKKKKAATTSPNERITGENYLACDSFEIPNAYSSGFRPIAM